MSPAESKAFVQNLRKSLRQWKQQVDSVKIDELEVNYELGKRIEKAQGLFDETVSLAQRNLDLITTHGSLGDSIMLEGGLTGLESNLDLFEELLLESQHQKALVWLTTNRDLSATIEHVELRYLLHLSALADSVQEKAVACGKK